MTDIYIYTTRHVHACKCFTCPGIEAGPAAQRQGMLLSANWPVKTTNSTFELLLVHNNAHVYAFKLKGQSKRMRQKLM